MKKVIIIVVGLTALCGVSLAQVTSFDHDKYWFYRWRLTHMFLHKGQTDYHCADPFNLVSGYSIPAGDLEGTTSPLIPHDVLEGKNANPHWGDGTSYLGWYMSVLATEWKLLKNKGQSTAAVEEELFYAMKAYERVDKNAGILFSPNVAAFCNAPDGFFGRDDVTRPFVQKYFPYADAASTHSEYLDMNTKVLGGPEDKMVNRLQPNGDSHPYNSVDQVSDLMMGFALIVKCLDNNTNYNGYHFKAQAKLYTSTIATYLNRNNYTIKEPITRETVKYGGIESQQDAYPVSKAAEIIVNESWGTNSFTGQFDNGGINSATSFSSPIWQERQTLAEDIEISKQNEYILGYRHELAAVGNSWQFGAVPTKCFTICVPIVFWCYNLDFWRYQYNIDPTGLTGFTQIFNWLSYLTCSPIKPPALVINTTGYTLGRQGGMFHTELYALMHQYLNGGGNSISDSFYQSAISSAPCVGPHYFPGNPAYQAPPGWRSSVRWQKRKTAFTGGDIGQVFSGLDYMLLYNLWALRYPTETKVSYHDELNPVYNFSSASISGKYYGFESIKITGSAKSGTGATFLSPDIYLEPGTKLTGNVTVSAPANGVSLECDASGKSFSREAADVVYKEPTQSDIDDYKKEYAQYVAQQLAPEVQKAADELAKHKYVPIQDYVANASTSAPLVNKLSDTEDSPVVLSPNPSAGAFTLSSDKPIVEVTLQTMLGESVYVKTMDQGTVIATIDASNLPAETYICIVRTTEGVVVKKWVKK